MLPTGNELTGAYLEGGLIGDVGLLLLRENNHHISVLPEFQRQRVLESCLWTILKKRSAENRIAETDEESVGFYQNSGFSSY